MVLYAVQDTTALLEVLLRSLALPDISVGRNVTRRSLTVKYALLAAIAKAVASLNQQVFALLDTTALREVNHLEL